MCEYEGLRPTAALNRLCRALLDAGDEDARSDSRLLLEWAMERPMERILLEEGRGLSPLEASRLEEGAARRLAGEPVQYITRRAYFYGRPFYVEKGVLIPRRDTETLVAAAQKKLHPAARVLDLCCGSGCVGISLALEGEYAVTASDISRAACRVTERNAKALGAAVQVRQGDLFAPHAGIRYDMIVANPPYIPEGEPVMELVVDHEPHLALFAGEDGLACYRRIVAEAQDHLVPGGWLFLEHGMGQSPAVTALLSQRGFVDVETYQDMEERLRVVGARRRKA